MKKIFTLIWKTLVGIFQISDKIVTNIIYAIIVLFTSIIVALGILGSTDEYMNEHITSGLDYIWQIVFFALTFFSFFQYILKDKSKYRFNEFVLLLMPIGALLIMIALGFEASAEKGHEINFNRVAQVTFGSAIFLISFSLVYTIGLTVLSPKFLKSD